MKIAVLFESTKWFLSWCRQVAEVTKSRCHYAAAMRCQMSCANYIFSKSKIIYVIPVKRALISEWDQFNYSTIIWMHSKYTIGHMTAMCSDKYIKIIKVVDEISRIMVLISCI